MVEVRSADIAFGQNTPTSHIVAGVAELAIVGGVAITFVELADALDDAGAGTARAVGTTAFVFLAADTLAAVAVDLRGWVAANRIVGTEGPRGRAAGGIAEETKVVGGEFLRFDGRALDLTTARLADIVEIAAIPRGTADAVAANLRTVAARECLIAPSPARWIEREIALLALVQRIGLSVSDRDIVDQATADFADTGCTALGGRIAAVGAFIEW